MYCVYDVIAFKMILDANLVCETEKEMIANVWKKGGEVWKKCEENKSPEVEQLPEKQIRVGKSTYKSLETS